MPATAPFPAAAAQASPHGPRWQPVSRSAWVALNVGLALLVFAAARLGLLTTLGPGDTTPIWPPSGIALAALMCWGPPVLPGLLLASIVNDSLSTHTAGFPLSAALPLAALMSLGAALQWMLVRRLLGDWDTLLARSGWRVVQRFSGAVLLGCVVAATFGSTVLWLSGQVAWAEAPSAWFTWWLGDVAAMLVLTPPLMALVWRRKAQSLLFRQAFPALTIGLGLSLAGTYFLGFAERATELRRANAELNAVASVVQAQLELAEADLREMAALHFDVLLSADQFEQTARAQRQRHAWLSAIAYLRRVSAGERSAYEAKLGEVRAWERDGSFGPAEPKPVLWVTERLDPEAGQEARLGLDESSDATRGEAIGHVLKAGTLGATGMVDNLQLASGEPLAVALYLPVFEQRPSGAAGPRAPTGMITAGIHLRTLLAIAIGKDAELEHDLLLISDGVEQRAVRMHRSRVTELGADEVKALLASWPQNDTLQRTVRIGQRTWALQSLPDALAARGPTLSQTLALSVGLLITGLLGAVLVANARRNAALQRSHAELEQEVSARTEALAQSHSRMERLANQRQALNEQLAAQAGDLSEARTRAEDANRAKSVFLANMSHEIRTPLNAVLGYAQLLREQHGLPSGAAAQVDAIRDGGTRLLRLINDVLDLSKIEAGALQLHAEAFDLPTQLDESVRLMDERASRAGVSLHSSIKLPRPLRVQMDRGKLDQIVLNLLGNAIKFTPQGGEVRLVATEADGQIDLRITDTGPGIGADELATLFTPFVQGESGARQGGTGLGLVLSRRLAQAMAGDLLLDSAPGHGTTAHLRLPLQRAGASLEAAQGQPLDADWRLAEGSSCCVLVAEDDAPSRDVLCQLLRRAGCHVIEASDGAQALAASAGQPVDIVLTDLRMPVMTGLALRDALAADPATRHWPVVAVTASSLAHEREEHLRRGFAEFIPKPYAFVDILRLLRDLAGVRLVPPPASAPADPSQPANRSDGGAAAAASIDWPAALNAAADGDTALLRALLTSAPAQAWPEALRNELAHALGRYDFDGVLQLLQRAQTLGTAPPQRPPA